MQPLCKDFGYAMRHDLQAEKKILGGYFLVMGMCRWMRSHFHDWIDYINRVTRMGSHIFGILRIKKLL